MGSREGQLGNRRPCLSRLGRVLKTFPGYDLWVRVAEMKTKNGTLVIPISKLCFLEEAVYN